MPAWSVTVTSMSKSVLTVIGLLGKTEKLRTPSELIRGLILKLWEDTVSVPEVLVKAAMT